MRARSFRRPSVWLASGWTLSAFVAAAMAQGLPESVQSCRKEPDNTLRLQCYDREVDKLSLTPSQRLGLESVRKAAKPSSAAAAVEAPKLTAKVIAILLGPHGEFVATLDNGQVWAQNEPEGVVGIKVGDPVTIKPGLLGSYLLIAQSNWSSKVHRTQ